MMKKITCLEAPDPQAACEIELTNKTDDSDGVDGTDTAYFAACSAVEGSARVADLGCDRDAAVVGEGGVGVLLLARAVARVAVARKPLPSHRRHLANRRVEQTKGRFNISPGLQDCLYEQQRK